jgi:hypothetical protein
MPNRMLRHRKVRGKIAIHQKVALLRNCAYSFRMSREFHISASALPGSLLPGLLLPLFLLR